MEFDLVAFGRQLRIIRNHLNLTLENVSELSGVNAETIRRIESGKVIPKLETLEFLSITYKQDINSLFLKYRHTSSYYYLNLKSRLEHKLYYNDYFDIDNDIIELEELMKGTENSYLKLDIMQLYLFAKAMLLYKKECSPYKALKFLIDAIHVTNPDFSLSNMDRFIYSPLEAWILVIIAVVEDDLSDTSLSLRILELCMKITEINDSVYIPLYYNLSYAYKKTKNYEKSIEMADKGIKACQINNNYFGLPLLYLYKGLSLYHIGDTGYNNYFDKALILCQCFGQKSFKSLIENMYHEITSCVSTISSSSS